MHREALAFVARVVQDHGPFQDVVEYGSRDINGSPRFLFPDANYIGVDLADGPGVEVIGDAAAYQPPTPADVVVCCEVLEHVPQPESLIVSAWAALKPGGQLIVTTACPPRAAHSAVDGGPLRPGEWYGNIDPDMFSRWLSIFDQAEIEVHMDRGDLYASAVKAG